MSLVATSHSFVLMTYCFAIFVTFLVAPFGDFQTNAMRRNGAEDYFSIQLETHANWISAAITKVTGDHDIFPYGTRAKLSSIDLKSLDGKWTWPALRPSDANIRLCCLVLW
jgi:hypothetical protein